MSSRATIVVAALAVAVFIAPDAARAQTGASSIFQVVHTPNENFNNGLQAASASSPSDIWAVGQSTIHYDGTAWTAFPAPMIKGDNTMLNTVAASSGCT